MAIDKLNTKILDELFVCLYLINSIPLKNEIALNVNKLEIFPFSSSESVDVDDKIVFEDKVFNMGNFQERKNFDVSNFVVREVDLLQTGEFYLGNLFDYARLLSLHQKKPPTVTLFNEHENLVPMLIVIVLTDKPVRIAQNEDDFLCNVFRLFVSGEGRTKFG